MVSSMMRTLVVVAIMTHEWSAMRYRVESTLTHCLFSWWAMVSVVGRWNEV